MVGRLRPSAVLLAVDVGFQSHVSSQNIVGFPSIVDGLVGVTIVVGRFSNGILKMSLSSIHFLNKSLCSYLTENNIVDCHVLASCSWFLNNLRTFNFISPWLFYEASFFPHFFSIFLSEV